MNSDKLKQHELKEGQKINDAQQQQQFSRGQLRQQNEFLEKRKSKSHTKSKVNVEEKQEFQKLYKYQIQKKQNVELKMEIQKLTIEIQSNKKLFNELLKIAHKEKDQIQLQSCKRIKQLTDENILLNNAHQKRTLQINSQLQQFQKLVEEKDEEIYRLKNSSQERQNELHQKLIQNLYQFGEKQSELQSYKIRLTELNELNVNNQHIIQEIRAQILNKEQRIKEKDQQINEKSELLSNAQQMRGQLKQKIKDMQRKIAEYEERLIELTTYNNALQKRQEELKQLLHNKSNENKQKDEEILKLIKFLEDSEQNSKELRKALSDERKNNQSRTIYQNTGVKKCFALIEIDSLVLRTEKQFQTLVNIFGKKKPKSFKLLYRASDYGFDIKYKEKYCGIAHTVLLVKTEFGKVIGGYTPLKWSILKGLFGQKVDKRQQETDTSGESFIFSLSQNDKFILKSPEKNKAICHNNEFGPIFVSGICIKDRSNNKNKSVMLCDMFLNYVHPEYFGRHQKSWMKFTGSQDGKVYTQEWQVHQVIF